MKVSQNGLLVYGITNFNNDAYIRRYDMMIINGNSFSPMSTPTILPPSVAESA